MKNSIFLSLCLLPAILYGDAEPFYQAPLPELPQYASLPWLTGPLLTPGENVLQVGYWNIEPYLYLNAQYAQYDKHWHSQSIPHNIYSVLSSTFFQYGVTKNFDFQIVPQFSWNHTEGASKWTVGDMGIILDYQLLHIKKDKWWPNIKFVLQGTVPFGKYQHLNPKKKGTDRGGTGSINPRVGIVVGKIAQFSQFHFLRTRAFVGYTVPNPVHVKGLNAYGGGKGTRGKVFPGQSFVGLVGFEYTLSANWVLACDFQYLHTNKQRFKGHTVDSMKAPSSEQWSLAPAIEYDWSTHIGIISGVWFTAAGRNSPVFANWATAANFYF
jgi:hypothetical protein